jgi:hypothetical protein
LRRLRRRLRRRRPHMLRKLRKRRRGGHRLRLSRQGPTRYTMRAAAAKMLTRDEARWIAANVAKLCRNCCVAR